MRFLLDTNLLSETVKDDPDAGVLAWMDTHAGPQLAVSAMTLGEIRAGFLMLDEGKKKSRLMRWLHQRLAEQFAGRVLPVDEPIAMEWGRLTAESRRTGRKIEVPDALLVATALVRNLSLVSRNERHLAGWGAPVINPWTGQSTN